MRGEETARPRKRFGQHFLESAWVARLVDAISPQREDAVLEIGPGRGALTRALAPRVGRLVCVEIDRDLAAALAASAPPHVRVVTADFLELDVRALVADPVRTDAAADLRPAPPDARRAALPVRVVGNLPYNISSPILFKLLRGSEEGRLLSDATIMLQKEVADRVTAKPGRRAYGTLAIQVARLADADVLFTLPPGAFRPPPPVTSAVVRLRFRPSAVDVGDAVTFERIVRGVFLQRRKTLLNALGPVAAALGLAAPDLIERAGVDPRQRPGDLTLTEFARLSRAVL